MAIDKFFDEVSGLLRLLQPDIVTLVNDLVPSPHDLVEPVLYDPGGVKGLEGLSWQAIAE
jgi:hypothetical protein